VFLAGAAVLAASAIAGSAAELRFERIERATGPSHNSIFALAQDRDGYLWIGTQDGLNRFDGDHFAVWRHDAGDPASLSANRVNAVLEDSRRRLWVATAAGVDRFDRGSGKFERFELADASGRPAPVLELAEDARGRLWAGATTGPFGWREDSGRWEPVIAELAGTRVRRIRPSGDGDLWLLTDGALLRVRQDRVTARLAVAAVRSGLELGPDGTPWLDPDEPRDEAGAPRAAASALPQVNVQAVVVTDGGEILAGTHLGVRRRSASGEVQDLPVDPARPLANFVAALLVDRRGRIWAGTENGLYRHDPAAGRFAHHGGDVAGGLHVSALAEGGDGAIWVGTFGAGLFRLEGAGDGALLSPTGITLPQPTIWSMVAGGGALRIAGEGWLCELPQGATRASCAHDLPDLSRVGAMAEDDRGELWLAEIGALRHRTVEGWLRYPSPPEPGVFGSEELLQLLPEPDAIWVAGFGGALKRFDRARRRFELVSRVDRSGREQVGPVFDLLRARDGALWLATGDGVSRFDPALGTFEHYGPRDGLPGSNVYSLLEDDRDRLWLATNRGLARLERSASGPPRLRDYGADEGVVNVEFNRHARLRTSDGRFLFGGMSGITELAPERIVDDPVPPRVALTRIDVLGRQGSRRLEPHGLDRLELGPGDSTLAIEFVAVDLSSAPARRFEYRLEGLEPDWIDTDGARVARYAGLAPGDYRFRVRAANRDGVWTASPAALAIRVAPPYWATAWFRLAVVLTVAAALALLYRWRVRHLIELERMRLRIAGDLHDELGSDLSGIALASSRLGARASIAEADRRRLSEIEEASLRVMRGLRDIVWYVDPEHDTLESTARRMRSVARDLLPDVELSFVERLGDGGGIEMSTRRQVFLVFKELVHNVARHARARTVEVGLEVADGELRLRVADDGRGFDPAAASDGSGLASLRRRARQVAGRLEIDSRPGAGTRALLVVPMTRTRQGGGRSGAPRLGSEESTP
jgi:signal transduction histidine kinase/ligand-binding sensor domain-containing protein